MKKRILFIFIILSMVLLFRILITTTQSHSSIELLISIGFPFYGIILLSLLANYLSVYGSAFVTNFIFKFFEKDEKKTLLFKKINYLIYPCIFIIYNLMLITFFSFDIYIASVNHLNFLQLIIYATISMGIYINYNKIFPSSHFSKKIIFSVIIFLLNTGMIFYLLIK